MLAHLKSLATRRQPELRRTWKMRVVRGLFERGLSAEDVRQMFRLIDWLMELPPELEEEFRNELHRFEEERQMPYITSVERLAREEGREEGREAGVWIGQIRLLEELLRRSPTSDEELERMSVAELKELAEQLRGELPSS